MRWLAVLLAATAGLALGAAGLLLLGEDEPEDLLPDLDPGAPASFEIVQVGDTYRLALAPPLENVGPGPLVVEGERPGREAETMAVRQVVRRSDGSARTRAVDAEIVFAAAGETASWLVPGLVRVELRSVEDGAEAQPPLDPGICVGDRRRAGSAAAAGADAPERPVWTGDCGRGRAGLLSLRAGLSAGWSDGDATGPEPLSVDVTTLPAGRYLLVHRSNPERLYDESDYGNNAASVLLQLRRTTGSIPAVRVLARCPDSESCAARR